MRGTSTDQVVVGHDGARTPDDGPADRTEFVPVAAKPAGPPRWLILVELIVSVTCALLMVLLAQTINVSPLDRAGQVSGLAGLQWRFSFIALGLMTVAVLATTAKSRLLTPLMVRVVAAGMAGLATGLIAGAVVVALRGTSWGVGGPAGDALTLTAMANDLLRDGFITRGYPPGFIHALAWYSELTGSPAEHSMKVLQIVLTALFGPAAYVAWRLLLSPMWALGIGVLPALALVEPYKPYSNIMLVVLIPVVLALLRKLRRSGGLSWRHVLLSGVGFGAALGVIFLVYSGWFVWSAPGLIAAALVVFPWRTGWSRGLALIATAVAVFVLIAHRHLFWMLNPPAAALDRWFYFDTWVDPAYIAMTLPLPPANVGQWPPPGEFGGVGLFTIVLFLGLVIAIAVAFRRTVVLTLTFIVLGVWGFRFIVSSQMYADNAVRLYPRTSPELLYCLLLLGGFAIYYATETLFTSWRTAPTRVSIKVGPMRIGALVGCLLLIGSAGSAIGDRYMPRTDGSWGTLSFIAQVVPQTEGRCSAYAATWGYGCHPLGSSEFGEMMRQLAQLAPRAGELPHRAT
jgi:hypothetical protein